MRQPEVAVSVLMNAWPQGKDIHDAHYNGQQYTRQSCQSTVHMVLYQSLDDTVHHAVYHNLQLFSKISEKSPPLLKIKGQRWGWFFEREKSLSFNTSKWRKAYRLETCRSRKRTKVVWAERRFLWRDIWDEWWAVSKRGRSWWHDQRCGPRQRRRPSWPLSCARSRPNQRGCNGTKRSRVSEWWHCARRSTAEWQRRSSWPQLNPAWWRCPLPSLAANCSSRLETCKLRKNKNVRFLSSISFEFKTTIYIKHENVWLR